MAKCVQCGKNMGFFEAPYGQNNDTCGHCFHRVGDASSAVSKENQSQLELEIDAILLTTETAPNLPITERIEIVTAECAFGMNVFKDLFAGIRDIVGGRSEAVQRTMRDSRRTALYELKKEAHRVGANAVVGVDLDYVELSGAGSMVLLVASGTAVMIDE